MRYCQIYRTAEPKIVGVATGASQVELIVNESQPDYLNYLNFEKHFDFNNKEFWEKQYNVQSLNPPIFNGVLRKKATVTDLMKYGQMFSYLSFIYSQKFIDILASFNVANYKAFPVAIKDVTELYYLLFLEGITCQEIIFDKSLVYTGHKVLNNLKYYEISTNDEFIDLLEKEPLATFEKIAISKEHYLTDVINIQGAGAYFYSEKLIDFLLDCGITGMEISYKNSMQLEFV